MSAPIDDVPRLRSLDNYRLEAKLARQVGQAALDTGKALPTAKPGSLPGDKQAMRGIPLQVHKGLGGAIRGTRPTDAIRRMD